MFINPAIEAIKVQQNSKLGADMTKLFEECYSYRKKYYSDIYSIPKISKDIAKIIEQKLPKIILDNTGLDIVKFNFQTDEPTGMIAIDYVTNMDALPTYVIDQTVSGKRLPDIFSKIAKHADNIKKIKAILDITKTYDHDTGKISHKWPITLFIDIPFLIFLDVYMDIDNNGKYINEQQCVSPEEITAILLHEIGHAMIFLERANVMYYVARTASDNATQFFSGKPELSQLQKFNSEILIPMVEYLNRVSADNETVKLVTPILKPITTFLEMCVSHQEGVKPNFDKNYTDTDVIHHSSKIFSIGAILHMGPISLIFAILFELIFKLLLLHVLFYMKFEPELNGFTDTKTSDVKTTAHNLYLYERLADEYATRHGYGHHIASALSKIHAFFDKRIYDAVNRGMITSFLTRILLGLIRFGSVDFVYEQYGQRIRRIVQNTMVVLKDQKLDKSFRDSQLKGLEKTLKLLDDTGTKVYNQQQVGKLLQSITSVDDWIRICTSGRLTQEYEAHLNQVEDLMNNFMYAHAAKFRQLFDNMKK